MLGTIVMDSWRAISLAVIGLIAMGAIVAMGHDGGNATRTDQRKAWRTSFAGGEVPVTRTTLRSDTFAGTGAWMDIFDDWSNARDMINTLHHHHVATLYVETSNSSQSYDVRQPD